MEVAEWSVLQNRFYRKHEIHLMQWQRVDLSRHKVACARFGGPIAMIRDESKMVQLRSESVRPKLLIFSATGRLLTSFVWDRPGGKLVTIGWTDEEILLCVVQDGTIFQYNIHGELLEQSLSLGEECWTEGVAECVIWGSGLVCLTEGNKLFCISDLKQPQAVKLADPGLEEPPHCMAVLEPQYTLSGHVEVLLAVGSSVLVVDADAVQDQMLTIGPLQKIAVSVGGNFLACFTHDGRMLVVSSDFSKTLLDFNTPSALPPEQLVWCGLDSVLLYWEELLLMVGPYGDEIRYVYDEPIFLVPECDGVRILSNSATEFLQRLPDSTVSIFGIGSTSPAAMLYDALDHFDKRSAKADENIRLIESSLPEAVESCIDAAGHEFDIAHQRTLMRAAAYGLAFCTRFPRNRFLEMCKSLRVLNAVRSFDVGIPLSIQQYKVLTAPVLVARLVNARRHLLALRISEFLGLSQETVLVHWACSKISATPTDVPDSVILHSLVEKLKVCPGTSFAAVAAHAHRSGRQKLAALLLDYEPRSSEQVPLLTSMGEEERALVKAIESGDTDLVYFAIFYILRQRPTVEFVKIVQAKPLSRVLFIIYAKQNDRDLLKKFYLSIGQPQGAAEVLLRESWEQSRTSVVGDAQLPVPRLKMIEQAHGFFSQLKDHQFEATATDEQLRLLKLQLELEAATGQPIFVDSSVSDTIRTCIMLGNHRAAQKIRIEFKVPDKRFWWLKVFALAALRDWAALEKFSTEKKSPIGYMPFVEACIDEGENTEALKYVSRIADPQQRAEAYTRLGMAKEAAEAAAQAKDGELMGRIRSTFATNTPAGVLFDSIRDRLSLQGAF